MGQSDNGIVKKTALSGMLPEEIDAVCNLPQRFQSLQIFQWIARGCTSFEEMTNLSKELIAKLNENYYIDNLEILKKQVSVDGTKKYLIKLPTGGAIETVLMSYNHRIYNMCINTKRL